MMDAATTIIQQLEDKRYAAMLAKDVDALDRLLHDDLVYMHSSGVADTKASYIAGVRDRIWDYSRIDRSDHTFKMHDKVALVFNRLSISIEVRGVPKELDNRALTVWVPFGDSWRVIAVQSGVVPPSTK
jgi:ketosteroid isomerase-like protein